MSDKTINNIRNWITYSVGFFVGVYVGSDSFLLAFKSLLLVFIAILIIEGGGKLIKTLLNKLFGRKKKENTEGE